ncbi:transcriptional coactivator p15/PC4 family protein [Salegentibacter mishustinae]|uniref:transcriptional coactivator p15/PC4 family protein n=1 Tax=Salegentibacter mishustinae TaxID=270918 RepID=UPI00248F5015|nr:transcriptional coactivator p15/PC4 family protein [Salegentibacter mishustinae]
MEFLNLQIGNKRSPILISLKIFKGIKLFDIRKFYMEKETEDLKPTRKGISLNQNQLNQFLEKINENTTQINDFFDSQNSLKTEITYAQTMGRKFDVRYENNEVKLILDHSFKEKYGTDEINVLKKVILATFNSLYENLEDEAEIQTILDSINFKI